MYHYVSIIYKSLIIQDDLPFAGYIPFPKGTATSSERGKPLGSASSPQRRRAGRRPHDVNSCGAQRSKYACGLPSGND